MPPQRPRRGPVRRCAAEFQGGFYQRFRVWPGNQYGGVNGKFQAVKFLFANDAGGACSGQAAFQQAAESGSGFFRQRLVSPGDKRMAAGVQNFGKKQRRVQRGACYSRPGENGASLGQGFPNGE
jgi:hypothetical protein